MSLKLTGNTINITGTLVLNDMEDSVQQSVAALDAKLEELRHDLHLTQREVLLRPRFPFARLQTLKTKGNYHMKHFVVGNHTGSSHVTPSHLLRWNATTQQFDPHHTLGNLHGTIQGEQFLAFAQHYNGVTRKIPSRVFRWDAATERFDVANPVGSIQTRGAHGVTSFVLGSRTYLVFANHHDDSTYNV